VDLGRVLTAMVTPFKPDGTLDADRGGELAAYLVANGNDGVVVCGTTGESPVLTHDEKLDLLRAVRAAIPNHPIVMGTGTNDTAASIAMSREALKLGATAVMGVVPYYNKPPQKSLYAHFKAIADAIDGPLVMYNVPTRTAANMTAETAIRLSELPNIIALKEASADLTQCAAVTAGAAPGFRVYSGDDILTLPMLAVGAHGVVSVPGHFAGPGIKAMVEYFAMGDNRRATELHHKLTPIFRESFCTTSPVPTKALFRRLGWDMGDTRLPLSMDEISDRQLDDLEEIFGRLGDLAGRLPVKAAAPTPA
jgi:4-hydroxy-tetrahydrodipicolinate synthase